MDLQNVAWCATGALLVAAVAVYGCSSSSSQGAPLTTGCGSQDGSAGDGGAEAGDNGGDDGATPPTPDCTSYCMAIAAACPGNFGAAGSQAQYPSNDGCLNLCQILSPGAFGDQPGVDSLGCRLGELDAGGACAAAGSTGGGVCNDPTTSLADGGNDNGRCASFCSGVMSVCVAANGVNPQPYVSYDTCMAACGTSYRFDPAQAELTTAGNTLNCRQYHLLLAFDGNDGGSYTAQCPGLGYPASAFCR
jgi:hypothetical protein